MPAEPNPLAFSLGPLAFFVERGLFWVRLFGFGLHAKDGRRRPLTFSERNGCHRELIVNGWRFRLLPRRTP